MYIIKSGGIHFLFCHGIVCVERVAKPKHSQLEPYIQHFCNWPFNPASLIHWKFRHFLWAVQYVSRNLCHIIIKHAAPITNEWMNLIECGVLHFLKRTYTFFFSLSSSRKYINNKTISTYTSNIVLLQYTG